MDEETKALRGRVYREHLAPLSDEAWTFAVEQAVSTLEWFPTVSELLTFADTVPRLFFEEPSRFEGRPEDSWRHSEGEALRKIKGHENDSDPDWSKAELSVNREALAQEFYDWIYARGGAKDRKDLLDAQFDAWCESRWQSPLTPAAKGILRFEIKERQFVRPQPKVSLSHYEATVRANPRRPDEGPISYIERIAILAGGMEPGTGILSEKAVAELAAGAHLGAPAKPMADVRLPHREAE